MTVEIPRECQDWLDAQDSEFMVPQADYFSEAECAEYGIVDSDGDILGPGYYSRLSAPGYMDCTDWQGPYFSPEEALIGLWEEYGD